MDELDRLKRENTELKRQSSQGDRASGRGGGIGARLLSGAAGLTKHLLPTGGLQHPDRAIRNRDLYIGGGRAVSPVPGVRPGLNKALLTGGPRVGRSKGRKARRQTPPRLRLF